MTQNSPVTKRIRLQGHNLISRTTIHGWPAILFGLGFLPLIYARHTCQFSRQGTKELTR